MRPPGALLAIALLAIAPSPAATTQDDAPLGLADLAAERRALAEAGEGAPPPVPATFRDLWERPGDYQGRRVTVGGKVVRSFRQDAVASFPPLVEAWIEQPPGDLLCIVHPAPAPDSAPRVEGDVEFTGVYLRRIRYRADGDRLAPLIVGPAPPVARPKPAARAEKPGKTATPGSTALVGWMAGLAALGLLLAWRSLTTKPATGSRRGGSPAVPGPPPEFLEPEADHAHD